MLTNQSRAFAPARRATLARLIPLLFAPLLLTAQVASGPETPVVKMEAYTITGSQIKRVDEAKSLPVLKLDRTDVEARDAATPIEFLSSIPQVTNTPLAEGANNSYSARGDFNAINLRGIGSGNTLILLNGRRLAPHPISSTDENGTPSAAVNVNQLPTTGIERTEVLLDGASSVYGTDAVAGVVNAISSTTFRGTEVGLRYSETKYQDGQQFKASILDGRTFAGGRGALVTALDFFHREAVYSKNRPGSASSWPLNRVPTAPAPWNDPASTFIPLASNPFYALSAQSTYPMFRVGATVTYFSPVNGPDSPPIVTTTVPVRGGIGYAFYGNGLGPPGNSTLLPRSNRYNFLNEATFELNDNLTLFSEVAYYRSHTTFWRQPALFNAGASTDNPIVIPVGTPNNPYTQPLTFLTRSLTDLGQEKDVTNDSVMRFLGGVRGKLGTSSWTWEAAAYYTQAEVNDTGHNTVRESLFAQAVISGEYNPFGYQLVNNGGVVSVGAKVGDQSAAISKFRADWTKEGFSSITAVDARVGGNLFELWSGPVQLAAGAEYREEEFRFEMPPYAGLNPVNLGPGLGTDNNDFLLFGPAENWSARRGVASAYAESVLPLVSPKNAIPFVRSLNLSASLRSERSSDYGSVTKPKIGFDWRPFSWLLFRASYNQGYRAPTLPALNGGQRKTTLAVTDPVNNNLNTTYWSIIQGNRKLKPEFSQGKSAGVVIDAPFAKGLSLNVDYWEIKQYDLITTPVTASTLLNDAQLLAPIVAANPGVPFAQLPFGSGTAAYKGNPNVIRNANNTLYGVVGQIFNASRAFTSGVDLNLSYRLPETSVGRFTLTTNGAYLAESYIYGAAGSLKDNRNNLIPNARWHGSAALNWKKGPWSAGLSSYLIGGAQTTVTLPVANAAQIAQSEALWQSLGQPSYIQKGYNLGSVYYRRALPSITTYNAFLSYRFEQTKNRLTDQTTVRVGIDNLTAEEFPFGGAGSGGAGALGLYNSLVPSRTYVLEIKRRF